MSICKYLPISLANDLTDHLADSCSFVDRDMLMRHIGGGVGHHDARTEEEYEDEDDEQMGAAGEDGLLPNACGDEDAAAEESDSDDAGSGEGEDELGSDGSDDLGPEDGEDGEQDPYDDL
jgi:hypothetical protein